MGILAKTLGIANWSLEDPAQPLAPMSYLFESLGLGRSDAGVMVNEKQAMRLTTMFACITVISQDLSSLPLSIWQRMPDGSVREATDHRLYPVLSSEPNDNMTSATFRAGMIAGVLAWGNSYALIRRDKAGRAVSLHLLAPDKTSAAFVNGKLGFATTQTADGQPQYIPAENMLHVIGTSFDGISGLSPVQTCKNAFGLSIGAEQFGARFFGNGARASGVVSHPAALNAEAYANLKRSIREWATGEDALRPIVLEEGMSWTQLSVNNNDAQFLETRAFQRAEIASLYRVPLHLLQDLQRSTNNNIEHQGIDYSKFCLKPLAVKIEQELNRKLLSGPFFAEHAMNDLMRGDFASQTEGLIALRNGGVYSANDVLRSLRQNPIPTDEGGDVRIVQGANIPLDSLVDWVPGTIAQPGKAAPQKGDDNGAGGNPVAHAFRRVIRDAVGRVARREKPDEQFTYRAFQPALAAMAEAITSDKLSPGQAQLVSDYTRALRLPDGMTLDEAADKITADACAALSEGLKQ